MVRNILNQVLLSDHKTNALVIIFVQMKCHLEYANIYFVTDYAKKIKNL